MEKHNVGATTLLRYNHEEMCDIIPSLRAWSPLHKAVIMAGSYKTDLVTLQLKTQQPVKLMIGMKMKTIVVEVHT